MLFLRFLTLTEHQVPLLPSMLSVCVFVGKCLLDIQYFLDEVSLDRLSINRWIAGVIIIRGQVLSTFTKFLLYMTIQIERNIARHHSNKQY